jgi:hypothetical protein
MRTFTLFIRPRRVPRVYLGSAFRAILAILASYGISNLRASNTGRRSESRRPRQVFNDLQDAPCGHFLFLHEFPHKRAIVP